MIGLPSCAITNTSHVIHVSAVAFGVAGGDGDIAQDGADSVSPDQW